MNPALAQVLESAAVLGAIVRPLLVATLLAGLWFALTRARLAVRESVLTWSVVATVLVVWLITVWTLAARGTFTPAPNTPGIAQGGMIVAPVVLLVAAALTNLMRSETIAVAIDAAPLWWLVSYQGYRVTGLIFVKLGADGFLPGFLALPAGIGDMLTGVLAIGAANHTLSLWQLHRRARASSDGNFLTRDPAFSAKSERA